MGQTTRDIIMKTKTELLNQSQLQEKGNEIMVLIKLHVSAVLKNKKKC